MSGPVASSLAAAPADSTSMALIIAAVLVGAAAAWLAIELRRAWSPEAQQELRAEPPVPERRDDREITFLLEDVAEELVELRATVEQLRSAPPAPVAAPQPAPPPPAAPVVAVPEPEPAPEPEPEPAPRLPVTQLEPEPEPVPPPPPLLRRPRPAFDNASWPNEVDIERYNQLKIGRMLRDPQRYHENGDEG
jgi:hypothetical protein